VNVFDDLETGNVGKEKIDHDEAKALPASLLDSIKAIVYENYFVALSLEDEPEGVTHRRLIVNNKNADSLVI
jgi:hypothetical protein